MPEGVRPHLVSQELAGARPHRPIHSSRTKRLATHVDPDAGVPGHAQQLAALDTKVAVQDRGDLVRKLTLQKVALLHIRAVVA